MLSRRQFREEVGIRSYLRGHPRLVILEDTLLVLLEKLRSILVDVLLSHDAFYDSAMVKIETEGNATAPGKLTTFSGFLSLSTYFFFCQGIA